MMAKLSATEPAMQCTVVRNCAKHPVPAARPDIAACGLLFAWNKNSQQRVLPRYDRSDPENRKFAMSILISLLITVLVIFLVLYLVQMLPLDGRAKQIVQVIVVVIGIISLLRYLAVF
jgi:hypothetical protein